MKNTRCASRIHECLRVNEARVFSYNDEALRRVHCYSDVVSSRLALATDAQNMRFLIRVRQNAAQEQLQMSQIVFKATLHTLLVDLDSISPAVQIHLPSAFFDSV